jgi:hypothetical protein
VVERAVRAGAAANSPLAGYVDDIQERPDNVDQHREADGGIRSRRVFRDDIPWKKVGL